MVLKTFRKTQNHGQAMVEFVLGLMIVISFFFFYIKMCAVFSIANYIHYATFMSARALSSSAATPQSQMGNAEAVMNSMVIGHFKSIIKPGRAPVVIGGGDFYKEDQIQDSWNQGVSFNFTAKLSLYPWNKTKQSIDLDLTSESWMPREDSIEECKAKKGRVLDYITKAGLNNVNIEWDNGGADGC